MILEEEAHVEEEKKKALIEARQRFVEETQLALAEQEKQLGLLIARLQVGQARRQVLIKKQDKAIKQLEVNIICLLIAAPLSLSLSLSLSVQSVCLLARMHTHSSLTHT